LQVSCGATHMVAVLRSPDGKASAYVFGEIDSKKPGKGGQASVLPAAVYTASSADHLMTLLPSDGTNRRLWGLGNNQYGQLGTGNVKPASSYVQSIIAETCEVVKVACGSDFTIALFRGTPPEKLVDGTVEKFIRPETPEEIEARMKKEADAKAEAKALQRAEEDRKRREIEEAERRQKEEEEKKRSAKQALLQEHYGSSKPCAIRGCYYGRKGGAIHCQRHFEDPTASLDPEALPPQWQAHKHDTGKYYYTNNLTKKTQWKRPDFNLALLQQD